MAIRAEGLQAVTARLGAQAQAAEAEIIRQLQYAGEQCLIWVRDRPMSESWIDHTGNLLSSIGYIVTKDGKPIGGGGFSPVASSARTPPKQGGKRRTASRAKTTDGKRGESDGRRLAEEVGRGVPSGFALVLVAGMHYAVYVEAMESKDVLASTSLKARTLVGRLMAQLEARLNKMNQ